MTIFNAGLGLTIVSVGVLVYTYIGYPLVAWIAAKTLGKPLRTDGELPTGVAVVLAVRNERDRIVQRVHELGEQLDQSTTDGQIIVVVNGSTDGTAEVAKSIDRHDVQVILSDPAGGKAMAVSTAVSLTTKPMVVLADARQRWRPGAVSAMMKAMRDPQVGGVSGQLVLEQSPGVMAGVGAYWKYEKWIRLNESRWWSQIGVTGAIAAVRRDCFVPIPAGTILDDVFWPMQVAMQGYRVVSIADAVALDQLPEKSADELRRKVRTLAGNFQLVAQSPRLLVPIVNPLWGRFVSHKLMRLVCPWAMLGVIVGGLMIGNVFGWLAAGGMAALICVGVLGIRTERGQSQRLFAAAGSLVLLNWAAVLASWYYFTGRVDRLWDRSVQYRSRSS